MYVNGYYLKKYNFIVIVIYQNTQNCSIFKIFSYGMFMNVFFPIADVQ